MNIYKSELSDDIPTKICENEKKLIFLQNESRPLFEIVNIAEVKAWYR